MSRSNQRGWKTPSIGVLNSTQCGVRKPRLSRNYSIKHR